MIKFMMGLHAKTRFNVAATVKCEIFNNNSSITHTHALETTLYLTYAQARQKELYARGVIQQKIKSLEDTYLRQGATRVVCSILRISCQEMGDVAIW